MPRKRKVATASKGSAQHLASRLAKARSRQQAKRLYGKALR